MAVTPVFPGKHQKRRLVEEDKEAKKVKKEEDNIHIIFAKNHAKEEEQREGKEMESLRSKPFTGQQYTIFIIYINK